MNLLFNPDSNQVYRGLEDPKAVGLAAILGASLDDPEAAGTLALDLFAGHPSVANAGELYFASTSEHWTGSEKAELSFLEPKQLRGRINVAYAGGGDLDFISQVMKSTELHFIINALSGILSDGGVYVSATDTPGVFHVRWNDVGARADALTFTHEFGVSLTNAVTVITAGDASTRELREIDLRTSLIADDATLTAPAAATISATVTNAGAADEHEQTKIAFSTEPKNGNWTVSGDGGTTWSAPLDVRATPWEVQAALDAQVADKWQVIAHEPFEWIVERTDFTDVADLQVKTSHFDHNTLQASLDVSGLPALMRKLVWPHGTRPRYRLKITADSGATVLLDSKF